LFWAPLVLASIAAALSAYSIAVGLDRVAGKMAELQSQWSMLSANYERLWHHWYEDDAEERLDEILRRDREVSQAGTEAPNKEFLIEKWQDRVNLLRGSAVSAT
jgi:hypothetical protein